MSKKNFTGGLNSLLGEQNEQPKKGRPVTQTKEITKSSQEGTKENETRATFIINEEYLEKLKAIAYWDRKLIKDVINTSIQETIEKYEKKHGAIKPRPEEIRIKEQQANQKLKKKDIIKAKLPKY